MKSFEYIIKDKNGIHARPAGLLSKTAKEFDSECVIEKDSKKVNLTKLMMLMGLAVKCGDKITVSASGSDEEAAIEALHRFFEENL